MKNSARKFFLFYIAVMLSAAPMALHAAEKKSYKTATSSSKAKVVNKYKKVKFKSSAPRVHNRIHTHKAMAVDAYDGSTPLKLASLKALVINQLTGETVYAKNTDLPTPIASVTKLMTAMVMLDAHLPMDDLLYITDEDVDYLKGTKSRLGVGTTLTRGELLQLALIASENRAASALGRNYPGGITAFVNAMNHKAQLLGMKSTHFVDSSGLNSNNVSTAGDLAKMVNAAYAYPEIRQVSTTASQEITLYGRQNPINFVNTNALVRAGNWVIGLSKTGFINEAGRCLVMQAEISGQPMIIVLLDSAGKMTRVGDANRIRKWVEHNDMASLGQHVSG
ncbi:MAG: D-alanyl-D-alanine endopeptidase [Methylotenera sp.]|nr:D-alanyl-D-alanine endopeptidase [Methylotenera sp.]MDP1597272.1 D-alanyl-D-alanine endopeptidase [Methylotenera sp.]MDP1754078.1 D-alanyl-D-alanine endopeptidase [Methylotenera sp.]MDP1959370.1 D-alanyl-D-alanine endopeptidase [Methylotenera sp.]MDP2404157.1 D-alanyl-D-alanine endopeptidase [Methylotenera sp.]